jgi:ABC-type branched-subunit amino acid transport system substrate-binding protein
MKMKKIFRNQAGFGMMGIIISIIVVIVALVVFFSLRLEKKESIKIGAVLPISGPGEFIGTEVMDGLLLAADEINTWGGINGRKIEFIIEDSKTNSQEGKKAFNRIEATCHPVLYVSMTSSGSMALAALAEQNKVVLIGLVATIPKLTKEKEWVFRYYTTAIIEVKPILPILQELKVKKLGILYLNDDYGASVFKLLKKEFEATGGIVRSKAFDPKEFDYKEQIAKLKDMEAIYSVGFDNHLKNVFKQLIEENFRGFLLGGHGATSSIVTSIPEANGVYVAAPAIYNPNFLFAKELKEKYEAKYNKPLNHLSANGYDFVKFLAGLLEDKEISRENVKILMEEGFIYSGVFGSIDVKPGDHDITFPLYPARIVDGKIKYLR